MKDEAKEAAGKAAEQAGQSGHQAKAAAKSTGRAVRAAAEPVAEAVADGAEEAAETARDVGQEAFRAVKKVDVGVLGKISGDTGVGFLALSVSLYSGLVAYTKFRQAFAGRSNIIG